MKYDAVIAGARCAGAATGLLLARSGARVLLVDKGAYGTDTLSTHALMRGAVLQLHRWGVLPAIVAAGTPPVRSTTFSYADDHVQVPIDARYGTDALYAPRRSLLDRVLVDAAAAAGAHVDFGVRVDDVIRDGNDRVRGIAIASGNGRRLVAADLVIGADGLHSTIADRVGAEPIVVGRHAAGVLFSYWTGLPAGGYHWMFRAGASAGTIPTNDGATCVFASVPAPRFRLEARGQAHLVYRQWIRQVSPDLDAQLAGAQRVEPIRGFGGHPGFIRRSSGPGWALVGDAAYFKDPATAHGITDALRDAELLARAVAQGTTAAFDAYESMRNNLSIRLFELTDAIASFAWTYDLVQSLHREFSREMSREVRALARLEPLPCTSPSASVPVAV